MEYGIKNVLNLYVFDENGKFVTSFGSFTSNETVSAYDLKVEIKPYNEEKDLFKMKLCK